MYCNLEREKIYIFLSEIDFDFELLFMNKVAKWQYTTGDNEHSRINVKAVKKRKTLYTIALRFISDSPCSLRGSVSRKAKAYLQHFTLRFPGGLCRVPLFVPVLVPSLRFPGGLCRVSLFALVLVPSF